MTLWHFLFAYLAVTLSSWMMAVRVRNRAWSAAAALMPVAGAAAWLFGLWIRLDWERGFLDQAWWTLAGHAALLVVVAGVAGGAWMSAHRDRIGAGQT